MATSTQYKEGQKVFSDYFGEAVIEEITGKHYLLRATDGRCMYHWTSEFKPMVQPRDAVILTDLNGHKDLAIVLDINVSTACCLFEDGSDLWVSLRHVTHIIARNVPVPVYA